MVYQNVVSRSEEKESKMAKEKLVGIQKRLVEASELALRNEIAIVTKPLKLFLRKFGSAMEESVCTDLTSEIEDIEGRLFTRLQIKWQQDSIDSLINAQKERDVKIARAAANRILRDEYEDDEEDYEDDDDDEEIVSVGGKYIPRRKRPPPRRRHSKRKTLK